MKIASQKAMSDAQSTARYALIEKDDFAWGAAMIALKIAYGYYIINPDNEVSMTHARTYYNAD